MPVRVYPLGRTTDILLVSASWRLRTPLRAQLLEDGYDVTAIESWDEAELLLGSHAARPRLIVFDVQGEAHPAAMLTSLGRVAGDAKVLILTGRSALPAEDVREAGCRNVLERPFRIRDIERKVAELLITQN